MTENNTEMSLRVSLTMPNGTQQTFAVDGPAEYCYRVFNSWYGSKPTVEITRNQDTTADIKIEPIEQKQITNGYIIRQNLGFKEREEYDRKQILGILKERNGPISYVLLCEKIPEIHPARVKQVLKKLHEEKFINRVDSRRYEYDFSNGN